MRSVSIILDDTITAIIVQVLRLKEVYVLINFFFFFMNEVASNLCLFCVSPDGSYLSNKGRKYKFANAFVCLIYLHLLMKASVSERQYLCAGGQIGLNLHFYSNIYLRE